MSLIEIVDGPSKWDLMLALFDAINKSRSTRFTLDKYFGGPTEPCEVVIIGVTRAPGVETWDISGELRSPRESIWQRFIGTYSTSNRHGQIKLESQTA